MNSRVLPSYQGFPELAGPCFPASPIKTDSLSNFTYISKQSIYTMTQYPQDTSLAPPTSRHLASNHYSIMASSDDDEDLKRAIALSLQDPDNGGPGETAREAISLDSDSEAEMKLARTAGCEEVAKERPVVKVGQNLAGLDRKQMEQERLSRKRKAQSISPPPSRKKAANEIPVASVQKKEIRTIPLQSTVALQTSAGSTGKGPKFLAGTVKKTWAFGHERKGDDIKLEEVLQKDDLDLAVLSSFQWDIDWLLAKINTRSTRITLVMEAKDQATQQRYRRETSAMPYLRLCFPSMEGQINCMHSKLMLLSHPSHLRVVVPTANLVPYDWGETGIVSQFLH